MKINLLRSTQLGKLWEVLWVPIHRLEPTTLGL